MLVIVNAGLGNVTSVANMFRRMGTDCELRTNPDGLGEQDRYVLPGVGAYDTGVARLRQTGWFEHLSALPDHTQVFGICLGMQLLGRGSEEGTEKGLGRYDVDFVRFRGVPRIPHMGWNVVNPLTDDDVFDPGIAEHRFYFTHTYHAQPDDPTLVLATASYGSEFAAACRREATLGVQFHPEKSHKFGMTLLTRWVELTSC